MAGPVTVAAKPMNGDPPAGRPLGVDQLLDAVTADPADPAAAGRLLAYREAWAGAGTREEAFLDARLEGVDLSAGERRPPIVNPIAGTAAAQPLEAGTARSLSPGEVAWLQRLPVDPAEVTIADARQVLRIRAEVTDPGDRLLLDSIATPLIEHHDRQTRRARAQAVIDRHQPANGRPPRPRFGDDQWRPPAGGVPLLAEAIRRETPELTEHEAHTRAEALLAAAAERRRARRDEQLEHARQVLATLDENADGS